MIDSKGGAFGFDCCLAAPKFRVFQQPARAINPRATATEIRGPCGNTFSANTTSVIRSIQTKCIIPAAATITPKSAQQQPRQ